MANDEFTNRLKGYSEKDVTYANDAKHAEPNREEVEFVARAIDFDKSVDWNNRTQDGENTRVLAKQLILGYRAIQRLGASNTQKFFLNSLSL